MARPRDRDFRRVGLDFDDLLAGQKTPGDTRTNFDVARKARIERQMNLAGNNLDYADFARALNFLRRQIEGPLSRFGIGQIDVRADILEASESSFDRLIGVNLKGPYFLTQRAAALMMGSEPHPDFPRAIVNVTSISAFAASVNRGDYCIAKAGLSMMTKLYAARLAGEGINVFEIQPGVIATDMTGPVKEKYDKLFAEGLAPISRWGRPSDIGRAVAAIARGAFPYSTGQVLEVDGGYHLRIL